MPEIHPLSDKSDIFFDDAETRAFAERNNGGQSWAMSPVFCSAFAP